MGEKVLQQSVSGVCKTPLESGLLISLCGGEVAEITT